MALFTAVVAIIAIVLAVRWLKLRKQLHSDGYVQFTEVVAASMPLNSRYFTVSSILKATANSLQMMVACQWNFLQKNSTSRTKSF